MEPPRDLQVLALGLPRTGTLSMAHALSMLGYHNVHHSISQSSELTWRHLSRAADASFPTLETYTGSPFTKADWDALYGPCEAVTECASLFAPQLIEIYPHAKVVLVVRDFDKWFQSMEDTILKGLWTPLSYFFATIVHPILGVTSIVTIRKLLLGFFEAPSLRLVRLNAKRIYEKHHQRIVEMVPKDQLLIYRMGDGWEPLCKFLAKPIPSQEFPWINEAAELKESTIQTLRSQLKQAAGIVMLWGLGVSCLGCLWFTI